MQTKLYKEFRYHELFLSENNRNSFKSKFQDVTQEPILQAGLYNDSHLRSAVNASEQLHTYLEQLQSNDSPKLSQGCGETGSLISS